MRSRLLLITALLVFAAGRSVAQPPADSLPGLPEFAPVCDSIRNYMARRAWIDGPLYVEKVLQRPRNGEIRLCFCRDLASYPYRKGDADSIYAFVRNNLPEAYAGASRIVILSNGYDIRDLLTEYYEGNRAPVREQAAKVGSRRDRSAPPLVTRLSSPFPVTKGLQGRHIALWQSHGYYFEPTLSRWEFQRSRLFGTVEDLFTQSYVLPFLVPMLENAGANVLLPRERDCNPYEIIVDNDDPGTGYRETGSWRDAPRSGFSDALFEYRFGENPFRMGTARMIRGAKAGKDTAVWAPRFPVGRDYAVYVSYQSLDSSTREARYEVHHKGGVDRFSVNQKMGGGTWIYLGTFPFDAGDGKGQGVYLVNRTARQREVVTADAVKFGGGMGNVARSADSLATGAVSGYPRFAEGARYWLQWAGFVDTVYAPNRHENDYRDDLQCRGRWVNTLSDGSTLKPDRSGYGIPLDLSLAFHTDAGLRQADSTVGTLAIYSSHENGKKKFPHGQSRSVSRNLADLVQSQIVADIRALYDTAWTRRGLWDRSYSESRTPEVPSMLLELLSHQNFNDMRYGLDPDFRFTACRAVYKGILRYLSWLDDVPYVVQPLPVTGLWAEVQRNGTSPTAAIAWSPSYDALEPTAAPAAYRIRTRVDDGAFDEGFLAEGNSARIPIEPGHLYSFQITALNAGGESFPSEIICAGVASPEVSIGKTALIVNNFDRVSAPASFATSDSSYAGFLHSVDAGVAYRQEIAYVGQQQEFRRGAPWLDDDNPGFGATGVENVTGIFPGNTFDFVAIHGDALLKAGYDFSSASRRAVQQDQVNLCNYPLVDLLCGKEATTRMGAAKPRHQVFPTSLRERLKAYAENGGNLLISGAYIASDPWDGLYGVKPDSVFLAREFLPAREFIRETLKYKWISTRGSSSGIVRGAHNRAGFPEAFTCAFPVRPNPESYCVESPDGLIPADPAATTILRYADTNISAAVFYKGPYRVIALGFPLEIVTDPRRREQLMAELVKLFE